MDNYAHSKIRESLLGSTGVGRCPVLSNQCTFGLSKRLAGRYTSVTELELIRFCTFPLGELVWYLTTQVNGGIIDT